MHGLVYSHLARTYLMKGHVYSRLECYWFHVLCLCRLAFLFALYHTNAYFHSCFVHVLLFYFLSSLLSTPFYPYDFVSCSSVLGCVKNFWSFQEHYFWSRFLRYRFHTWRWRLSRFAAFANMGMTGDSACVLYFKSRWNRSTALGAGH